MKKRATKKLVLNRETLAGLDRSGLQWAAGGTGTGYPTNFTCAGYSCEPDRCPYSEGQGTCFTCEGTCGTNYC